MSLGDAHAAVADVEVSCQRRWAPEGNVRDYMSTYPMFRAIESSVRADAIGSAYASVLKPDRQKAYASVVERH